MAQCHAGLASVLVEWGERFDLLIGRRTLPSIKDCLAFRQGRQMQVLKPHP